MVQITIIVVLVCIGIVSVGGLNFNRNLPMNSQFRNTDLANNNQWSSKLCSNKTLATRFLADTRRMIATLQSNNSYDKTLKKHTKVIAYLENADNNKTLSSNCTEYFNCFKKAQKLDMAAEVEQEMYEQNVYQMFSNILQALVGGRKIINEKF